MAYAELLKDPRWQKKRLQILESDGWKCRQCETKDKTLHVHHTYYIKGNEPWDYPDTALITLCESCHEKSHSINWQQAFLDLNMTPQRLLEIALVFHFIREKQTVLLQEINDKRKLRYTPYLITPEVDMSESEEELFQIFDYYRATKGQYGG